MFCDRLKEIRKLHNITQEQLASIIGMSRQAVVKYESGERFPDEVTLVRISDYFGISLDYLLDRNISNSERLAVSIASELNRNNLIENSDIKFIKLISSVINTLIIEFEKLNIK